MRNPCFCRCCCGAAACIGFLGGHAKSFRAALAAEAGSGSDSNSEVDTLSEFDSEDDSNEASPPPPQSGKLLPLQNSKPAPQQNGQPAPQQWSKSAPLQNGKAPPQQNGRPAPQQNSKPAPLQDGKPQPQQSGKPPALLQNGQLPSPLSDKRQQSSVTANYIRSGRPRKRKGNPVAAATAPAAAAAAGLGPTFTAAASGKGSRPYSRKAVRQRFASARASEVRPLSAMQPVAGISPLPAPGTADRLPHSFSQVTALGLAWDAGHTSSAKHSTNAACLRKLTCRSCTT